MNSRKCIGGNSITVPYPAGMDWFHCNMCFLNQNETFYITSCGHILCQKCITQDKCSVCKRACRHLSLSDNMKAQEKIFFRNHKQIAQKYFDHLAQVSSFQKQQFALQLAFYKHYLCKSQRALQDALQKVNSQESELKSMKKDNAELRTLVSALKGSLSRSQNNNRLCTPRPVAITSPSQTVTPQQSNHDISHPSSVESLLRGVSRSGGQSQPVSAGRVQERTTPISSYGSPMSTSSFSHRATSQSSSVLNVPLLEQLSNVSRDYSQTQLANNSPQLLSAGGLIESCMTPSSNTDRLRAIRLSFTPRTSCSYSSGAFSNKKN
ncbi:RING finger protein 212B isoform X2 [Xenopus laevis]|uniref:RING finger protein 212B isoform X2 n=2 Tax=Xenopus laevis TaxID=8355 RepID=A0A8J0U8L7_XENLA|nr:RING finger protein 212B isoform X2 [Xenopus laevis]